MPEIRNEEFQVVTLGAVKPDGTPDIANVLFRFPVPHQQMSIRQAVKVDSAKIPGRSGNVKQAVGYDDTEITISLTLVDEEDNGGNVTRSSIDQLKELQVAFRDRSDPVGENMTAKATYAVPTVFSIQSRLTDACGIKTVLFKSLDPSELPGTTDIEVAITFEEFEPIAVQVEKRRKEEVVKKQAQQQADAASGTAAGDTKHEAATGTEDPLAAAYRQGKEAAMGGPP